MRKWGDVKRENDKMRQRKHKNKENDKWKIWENGIYEKFP